MTPESRLRQILESVTPILTHLPESANVSAPLSEGKWSRKEILGHLIDSASNNHQRFVRAQLSEELVFSGYRQEEWVRIQRYRDASWESLVILWYGFNMHLARVIEAMDADVRSKPRETHNLDELAWRPVPKAQPVALEYFLSDYVDHLEHHLSQLIP